MRVNFVDYPISTIGAQDPYALGDMNRPLSDRSRVRASGDRLVADGDEALLFGANLGVGFLDDDGAFKFLAGMGLNIVRVFTQYREWEPSGIKVGPRTAALPNDRMQSRLLKQQRLCEQHGIYVLLTDFNRGLGRDAFPESEVRTLSHFGEPDSNWLGLWHPRVRNALKERVRRFLGARNPHTGKPYGASPSLMGIQLVNEAMWFNTDFYLPNSRSWTTILQAPEYVRGDIASMMGVAESSLRNLSPDQRILQLARATARIHQEFRQILESEFGSARPLLVADNAPYAGAAAMEAFSTCDAYGANMYPEMPNSDGVDGYIRPHDLRSEPYLDRINVRIGDKPTIITECGERLAPGGQSRLIADVTVRASLAGYSGICFHEMYRGIYGEYSGNRPQLSTRVAHGNFELSTDPGALCALQACAVAFRSGRMRTPPNKATIGADVSKLIWRQCVMGHQLHDLPALARQHSARARQSLAEVGGVVLLVGREADGLEQNEAVTVERGHARAPGIEFDWHTDRNPELDWLLIRVASPRGRSLVVLVGRSKPDPAEQRFGGGKATLSGLSKFPWPDPRTGFGSRVIVRRPEGPAISVLGKVFRLTPDGRRGEEVRFRDPMAVRLPDNAIRFVEVPLESLRRIPGYHTGAEH